MLKKTKNTDKNHFKLNLKLEDKIIIICSAVILLLCLASVFLGRFNMVNSSDKESHDECFDYLDLDYNYVVGDISEECDTYNELIGASVWYKDRLDTISDWLKEKADYNFSQGMEMEVCIKEFKEEESI